MHSRRSVRLVENIEFGSRDSQIVEHEVTGDSNVAIEKVAAVQLNVGAVVQLPRVRAGNGRESSSCTQREVVKCLFVLPESDGRQQEGNRRTILETIEGNRLGAGGGVH